MGSSSDHRYHGDHKENDDHDNNPDRSPFMSPHHLDPFRGVRSPSKLPISSSKTFAPFSGVCIELRLHVRTTHLNS